MLLWDGASMLRVGIGINGCCHNSVRLPIRQALLALTSFRRHLKTYYF